MTTIVISANTSLPPNPVRDRLIGRDADTLSATEEILLDHFAMYGELSVATSTTHHDYIELKSDFGNPEEEIDIRVPLDTPMFEAARQLADTIHYYLDSYLPEMIKRS